MNAFATNARPRMAPDTVVLCVTILVAPELLGGAFPWSVVVIAALSVSSLAMALWVRRAEATPVTDGMFIVMGVAWLWTCLQAVPLPSGLARALDVRSVQSAERLQGLAWVDSVPLTISYDPGATYLQILIGISILCAFLAARLGGRSRLKPLAVATVASAVLIGLVGFAHQVTGTNALFGIYSPRFTAIRLLAPLMNSNHLAGFSLMGALIASGLAGQDARPQARIYWVAASVFCSIVVVWTLSRGAIAALLFGFVLLAVWLLGNARPASCRAAIPVATVGAAVAGVIAFTGLEPILRRFEIEGLDKLELAAQGFRLLDGAVWWLGVGRGAFSSAFVTHEGSHDRFTHPENLLVQWTTEWGVPVAVALLLVLTLALWKRFRTAEGPLMAAVCVAIFALGLQNLVDFSLEMAGVVVVAAALLGALVPASSSWAPRNSRVLLVAFCGAFAAIVAVFAPRVLRSDTQSIVDRLTRAMQANDSPDFQATLGRGLALHPGEPALALLAAAHASTQHHPDAGRWLSIVMQEAPDWATPHAIAARWLFGEGHTDQALLEIREAEQRRPSAAHEVLCEILTRLPRMEHIERAAPAGEQRIALLNRTNASCSGLPAELRMQIDDTILEDEPTHASATLRKAQRLATRERSGEVIALLRGSLERNAGDVRLWSALIRAHLRDGDANRAQSALNEATSRGIDGAALSENQARIEAALGDTDAMRATLTRLRGQSRGEATLIARSLLLEGELEASLGNIDEALAAYAAADRANPATPALRYAATLALESGRPSHARSLYRTLCLRQPGGWACAREAQLAKEPVSGPHRTPMP